jgi:HK97 family phage prohead protease
LDDETIVEFDAPRDDLIREFDFSLIDEVRSDNDGLTLTGYAAVFNRATRIDSWEGQFDEIIAPGAFKRSINAGTPVLMFEHGRHPLVGSMPLGTFKRLREDSQGLYVEARLHDNWLIEPVRDAIASGAVTGMSFRFSVVREAWDNSKKVPLRTLQEVKVSELGPVVFPAYRDTSVAVRSLVTRLPDDLRADLAREIGTSQPPAPEGTGEEPAVGTDPASATRSVPAHVRRRRRLVLEGLTL